MSYHDNNNNYVDVHQVHTYVDVVKDSNSNSNILCVKSKSKSKSKSKRIDGGCLILTMILVIMILKIIL